MEAFQFISQTIMKICDELKRKYITNGNVKCTRVSLEGTKFLKCVLNKDIAEGQYYLHSFI